MKRNAIALIVHPCKDALVPRTVLAQRLNSFASSFAEAAKACRNVRLNLAIPALYLELLDPLVLLQLREISKIGQMEWLFTGYTEPFSSISPAWLLGENYKYGAKIFNELTGVVPSGIVVPHSNWEPSVIEVLRNAGVGYCVLSSSLLPREYRSLKGYWITEHTGASIAVLPAHVVKAVFYSEIVHSFDTLFSADSAAVSSTQILCIDLLCPLDRDSDEVQKGFTEIIKTLDSMLLSYQTMECSELISSDFNLGLRYIPSSIVYKRDDRSGDPDFMNRLQQYGPSVILHRKVMDAADNVANSKDAKFYESMKKELFFVQDVNRFLPSEKSGFLQTSDRLWSYSKLISIEKALYEKEKIRGGNIRVSDFLKNGAKTLILTNNSISAYIDYKNGGRVFEIDYKSRNFNICSVQKEKAPFFIDHCLPADTGINDFSGNIVPESGDFVYGEFGYKIKKSQNGLKAVLNRNGTVVQSDRNCPLSMEKVIGLEKDHSVMSFAYQLSNHSLTPYNFRFGVECSLVLPGLECGMARMTHDKDAFPGLDSNMVVLNNVTTWALDDACAGVRINFSVQKPVDLWCFPVSAGRHKPGCDITIVITSPVSIDGSKSWSLMGEMVFRKLRIKKDLIDAV
jgi:hypothetical protein